MVVKGDFRSCEAEERKASRTRSISAREASSRACMAARSAAAAARAVTSRMTESMSVRRPAASTRKV